MSNVSYIPLAKAIPSDGVKNEENGLVSAPDSGRDTRAKEPNVCNECGKRLTNRGSLLRHIKLVHDEPCLQQCPECNIYVKQLGGHLRRQHSSEQPSVCNECGKRITNSESLKKHIERVHTETECICDECGKKFKNNQNLAGHIKNVHTESLCICDICSNEFKNAKYLREHVKTVHSLEQLCCDECGKTCANKIKLKMHQRAVHTLNDCKCEQCGKIYKNKDLLRKHTRYYHTS